MTLITGHLGFIGSRLARRIDAVGIDIREGKDLMTCPLPKNIDCIYHLAAQSDVAASWEDPMHDADNLKMTVRLAHAYPKAKIIYANSCASVDPVTPYGFSKRVAGDYLKLFHKNTVNCIFPNIFGPGSRSVVDIFKNKEEVVVYGDGKQTRDYVHVDDIVRGLFFASGWKPGDYFMGSGKSTTVLELAHGKGITFAPARKELYEVNVPNTTPNWTPEINVFDYLHV